MSLISFQINSISSFPLSLYKYSIRQRKKGITIWLKTQAFWYCVVLLLCMIDFMVNISKIQALWLSFCVCERGIGGPPLSSLHTLLLPVNSIWIVLMVCLSSCRINFLIAELIKLPSINFTSSIISLIVCCRMVQVTISVCCTSLAFL